MNAEQLTVSDFQFLFDRGWARCGKWLYLPANYKLCCPTYTVSSTPQASSWRGHSLGGRGAQIRLDVQSFEPNRSQRRCLRRLQRYLETGSCNGGGTKAPERGRTKGHPPPASRMEDMDHITQCIVDILVQMSPVEGGSAVLPQVEVGLCRRQKEFKRELSTNVCLKWRPLLNASPLYLAEEVARRLPKSWEAVASPPGFVNFNRPQGMGKTEQVSSHGTSVHHQSSINNGKRDRSHTNGDESAPKPAHSLQVTLEDPLITQEKFDLYKKYQVAVHKTPENSNELQEDGFQDFLCRTPLLVGFHLNPIDTKSYWFF